MDISRDARIVMTHDAGGTSLKFTAIRGTPLRPGEARRGDNRRGREGQARRAGRGGGSDGLAERFGQERGGAAAGEKFDGGSAGHFYGICSRRVLTTVVCETRSKGLVVPGIIPRKQPSRPLSQ